MSEDEYLERLKAMWPRKPDRDASLEAISLVDAAVSKFPQSYRFRCMRGSLIQLGPENCPHPLEEALASYQHAAEIDPECAEAWEEIGHYYNAVLNDEESAEPFFEKARALKKRLEAELGTAPNGGPGVRLGNSGAGEGPPSVG